MARKSKSTGVVNTQAFIGPPTQAQAAKRTKRRAKKKAARNRRRGGTTAMTQRIPDKVVEHVCGLTDPFCVAAIRARPGTIVSTPTVPFRARQLFTITNNASGRNGILLCPTMANVYSLNASNTADQFTTGAAFNSLNDFSTWSPITDRYRTRSAGLKVRRLVNDFAVTGTLTIVCVQKAIISQTFDLSLPSEYVRYKRISMTEFQREISIVMEPVGDSDLFTIQNSPTFLSSDVNSSPNWCAYIVFVEGGRASTADIEVEFFGNYEAEFQPGQSALTSLATPPPKPSIMDTAASLVRRQQPAIFDAAANTVTNQFKAMASAALRQVAGFGVSALATRFLGPTAGAVAGAAMMIEDVD